jgi:hypothetical protein
MPRMRIMIMQGPTSGSWLSLTSGPLKVGTETGKSHDIWLHTGPMDLLRSK